MIEKTAGLYARVSTNRQHRVKREKKYIGKMFIRHQYISNLSSEQANNKISKQKL